MIKKLRHDPFPWTNFKSFYKAILFQILLVNPIITLIIFSFFAIAFLQFRLVSLLHTFIITEFIGTSIAIPMFLVKQWHTKLPTIGKVVFTAMIIIIFGNLGSFLAIAFVDSLLSQVHIHFWKPGVYFFNFAMAIIFGTGMSVYFYMRERIIHQREAIKKKEIEEEKIRTLQKSTELQALRSRIDPHFLFNTLNSIASLIRLNPKKAESMVEKLASLFRYTLYSDDGNMTTVDKEIELIRKYLEIEKIRLEERLEYEIKIEKSLADVAIPPLLIQPLVENCIKHGVSKLRAGGKIKIEAIDREDKIVFRVWNNLPEKQGNNQTQTGFGLKSIRERLELIYGNKAQIEIKQNGDFEVEIILPKLIETGGM